MRVQESRLTLGTAGAGETSGIVAGMNTKAHPRAAEATTPSRPLTPKQQRFAEEYLTDLNASAAYQRAGYAARGNAAEVNASRLLRNAQVAAAVAAGMKARSEKVGVDSEWVLRRLASEAEADLADLYDEQGNLRHPKDWPEVWRKGLVSGVESFMVPKGQDADGKPIYAEVRKVKLIDRTRTVELIGKHVNVGAFREQVGLSDPEGGPVQVAAVKLDALRKAAARVRGG